MLLTISTTHSPATDLGFLLHKHPDRVQDFRLNFGRAVVFYSQASDEVCSACLMLDIDPVQMIRSGKRDSSFLLGHYVNDRPYVASSFMSVAISQVFGSAMSGRSDDRPELAAKAIPLTAKIEVLPVRGDTAFVNRLFEPLGYEVESVRHPLDEVFPEWGESQYHTVILKGTVRLSDLLAHLYVLIPVFDNSKHYYIGDDELEKLLRKGGKSVDGDDSEDDETPGWLQSHPEREAIVRRYLKYRTSLVRQAVARLSEGTKPEEEASVDPEPNEDSPKVASLNQQRLDAVTNALIECGAKRVLDLGCGEGKLVRQLLKEKQFNQITGMDVSIRTLELAHKRLKLDRMPDRQASRVKLIHGSLMYRDKRFEGFDAAAVVEVIEHLDPPRLACFERVVFQHARPKTVVLTTPNREYNVVWESLPEGKMRHDDHRFEWTRTEFQEWANRVASQHNYTVEYRPIGEENAEFGPPTQMAIFQVSELEV